MYCHSRHHFSLRAIPVKSYDQKSSRLSRRKKKRLQEFSFLFSAFKLRKKKHAAVILVNAAEGCCSGLEIFFVSVHSVKSLGWVKRCSCRNNRPWVTQGIKDAEDWYGVCLCSLSWDTAVCGQQLQMDNPVSFQRTSHLRDLRYVSA